jgi:drug/metabolite transporter (DMT)-like permease
MPYLIGGIIFNVLFAQIYKLASTRDYDVDWVTVVSFICGTLLLLVIWAGRGGGVDWSSIGLGVAFGFTSGIAKLAYFRSLPYGRVSVSWTIIQLAMLIPVLASALVWDERPTWWQGVAIAGAVGAVAWLGDVELHRGPQPLMWAGWMGLTYVLSGLAQIALKAQSSLHPGRSHVAFLLTGYAVMSVVSLPLVRGRMPVRREAGVGIVRGVAALSMHFLVLGAAAVLPAYLVFPIYCTANVVGNAALAMLIWGERLQARTLLGILLALAAMVVLSL